MKEYYRIGETASLMGITTQTLRFYDKIGLVKPIRSIQEPDIVIMHMNNFILSTGSNIYKSWNAA